MQYWLAFCNMFQIKSNKLLNFWHFYRKQKNQQIYAGRILWSTDIYCSIMVIIYCYICLLAHYYWCSYVKIMLAGEKWLT